MVGGTLIDSAAVRDAGLAANVVDIRRFSTHDGQGIRTTIFLKGCSLACSWCQNPESIDPKITPVFFRSRCIDCGLCDIDAAAGAVHRDGTGAIRVDTRVAEADWRALHDVCPTEAITFDATRYTVAELVERAQRDRVFFGRGGGVTLSGGEPLFLPRFAAALAKALQAGGINVAIETALNVKPEHLFDTLPHLDHVFADLKLIDDEAHRRYTGMPNSRVLANLEALLGSDRRSDVTIRTPMIPGITDSEANIAGIAQFVTAIYPDVRYELLNYNPLAAAKYEVLPGVDFVFGKDDNPQMFSKAQMAVFEQVARDNGVRNIVVV